jgi:hypothetical protein
MGDIKTIVVMEQNHDYEWNKTLGHVGQKLSAQWIYNDYKVEYLVIQTKVYLRSKSWPIEKLGQVEEF